MIGPAAVDIRLFFPLAAGIVLNLSMGLLYGWSVLLVPLEESLDSNRASISLAYSLSFIFLMFGGFITHRLVQWIPAPSLALVTGIVGAIGLGLAGFGGSLTTLIIGFGVIYGLAAGVSYFLAMTVAGIDSPLPHSVSLSLNMAAFALGGVVWPPIFTALINGLDVHTALNIAALVLLGAGIVAFVMLRTAGAKAPGSEDEAGMFQDMLTDRPRIIIALFFGFTFLAFAALMVMGHAAGMAAEWQLENLSIGPMLANLGYIGGALLTGQICRFVPGRIVLVGISLIAGGAMVLSWASPGVVLGLLMITLVGVSFGGAATSYPVAITKYYGLAALPRVYGRLAFSYGIGGLLGPLAAGAIFDVHGSYSLAIIIAAILALLAAVAHGALPRK
jgi:MFS family permease